MNSNNAAIFSDEVASNMTTQCPFVGDVSNRSENFFEHAANISLWALKTLPGSYKCKSYNRIKR